VCISSNLAYCGKTLMQQLFADKSLFLQSFMEL